VSRTNAKLQAEADVEIVAVALWRRAHESGVIITRRWVDEQVERLRTHRPGCVCSEPCQLDVSAKEVAFIAISWQRQYTMSRVLARR
jgi:hypothetical protein